jgi:succinate-semialdehyde dehydrogenase / glutarate-semialdehyde dehydrogenase
MAQIQQVRTINPATGEVLEEFSPVTASSAEEKLGMAEKGYASWRTLSPVERGEFLVQLARELRSNREKLARSITLEMGKPIAESRSEIDKCAAACDYFGKDGPRWLEDRTVVEQNPNCAVTFRPLGPILGVMPWNFPFWQAIRFAAPTLLAGNVVLIKHAPNTWGSSRELEACFWRAGFAKGIYQDLPADVAAVEKIIGDPRIRGVSLTGSTRAGKSVAATAGRFLKKCVLELGGSDPYIVLDDADVAWAADKCVQARMINGGQSCVAAKRFIVTRKNAEEFTERVKLKLAEYRPADPLAETTRLGPLARADLRDQLHDQVTRTVREGARREMGGQVQDGPGFFYPATLLTGITPASIVHKEEFFGPVATISVTANEEEAVGLANHTGYGLGAAVFSRDEERARRIARDRLEAGVCTVNGQVRSDARWPFGGVKDSGLGRELGEFGVHEFVNVKTIIVDPRT